MKILFYDAKNYEIESFNSINKTLKNPHKIDYVKEDINANNVKKAKGYDAVCTFVNSGVDKDIVIKLKEAGIKAILQRSAGYNNIDLKQCKESEINVYRVPAYSSESISEFAFSTLMFLNRNLYTAAKRTKVGNFSIDGLEGHVITGSTIGIVGTGRIGAGSIRIALGFGAKVVAYDKYPNKELAKKLGFTYVSNLDEIWKQSDYISLHTILNDETKYMINKDSLSKMKENVLLINTSRGPLVNTKDLIAALKAKKIRGAALDVYEKEQGVFFFDWTNKVKDKDLLELMKMDNVLLTGHQAYLTNLSLQQISEVSLNNATSQESNKETNTRIYLADDNSKVING